MNFRSSAAIGVALAAALSSQAWSQGVVNVRQLNAEVANGIAMAALDQCRKDGFRVSVAIVDRAGNLQVLIRDNGAGPHTADTARRKAYTSASMGISTAEFASRVISPGAAGLKEITDVIPLAGALPIRAGNDLIAGIGVGGAPGGDKDEACAKAALDKFAAQLK